MKSPGSQLAIQINTIEQYFPVILGNAVEGGSKVSPFKLKKISCATFTK